MARVFCRCCCQCCCGFFGLTVIFLIVFANVKIGKSFDEPTLTIEKFHVSALNITSNGTLNNNTIYLDLRLVNTNIEGVGIHYNALNVTLYYAQNLSFPLANVSIPGFFQGYLFVHDKKRHRRRTVTAATGFPWEIAQQVVILNGTDVFRVILDTKVRYKQLFWQTKHHHIMVGGNVTVNNQGNMVKRKHKGVTLSSSPYVGVIHFAYSGGLATLVLLSFWYKL
ncbi:hypothetical protein ACHQM5_029375 [Ranunculus cassubicifolius]